MDQKAIVLASCIYSLLTFCLSAQKSDSLISVLNSQENDTNKVYTYQDLYFALRFQDREQAVDFLDRSIALATTLDFQTGVLNGLLAKGEYYETGSLYDSALQAYHISFQFLNIPPHT